ncbi:hypothetical protein FN846DRAFT_953238 [Sphaerosporella brunnea]|uniref:Uncharacterized protein n=1 Tax=Sphaerosporella brunnea TaxID=1250544 RepID=A0A5J5EVS5_9PEZI|nr:hypothetical protein FN846DRAFT_953238 [Sphaerosporella brunnea]
MSLKMQDLTDIETNRQKTSDIWTHGQRKRINNVWKWCCNHCDQSYSLTVRNGRNIPTFNNAPKARAHLMEHHQITSGTRVQKEAPGSRRGRPRGSVIWQHGSDHDDGLWHCNACSKAFEHRNHSTIKTHLKAIHDITLNENLPTRKRARRGRPAKSKRQVTPKVSTKQKEEEQEPAQGEDETMAQEEDETMAQEEDETIWQEGVETMAQEGDDEERDDTMNASVAPAEAVPAAALVRMEEMPIQADTPSPPNSPISFERTISVPPEEEALPSEPENLMQKSDLSHEACAFFVARAVELHSPPASANPTAVPHQLPSPPAPYEPDRSLSVGEDDTDASILSNFFRHLQRSVSGATRSKVGEAYRILSAHYYDLKGLQEIDNETWLFLDIPLGIGQRISRESKKWIEEQAIARHVEHHPDPADVQVRRESLLSGFTANSNWA